VVSVEIGIAAGLSYVREQSEEAFSLCRPICNCVLSIGVLDHRVRDTKGQHVFDEDAVGQYLSDVSVAGTRQRATRGFQLNRNDTMTCADQVVWTPGEAIPVGDQRPSWVAPAGVGIDNRARRQPGLVPTKVQPACECHRSQGDQEKHHRLRTQMRISSRTSTRNARPKP
jgi:hypothetical protein